MRQLHWFQTDLRLADNPALASATGATNLLCVYLMPKPRPWCNLTGIGPQRDRFLRESLQELKDQLKLTYNKARQAAITNEILEIVGGAEALNS